MIDAEIFGECVRLNSKLWEYIRRYAATFIKRIKSVSRNKLTDLVDQLFSSQDIIDECDLYDSMLKFGTMDSAAFEAPADQADSFLGKITTAVRFGSKWHSS